MDDKLIQYKLKKQLLNWIKHQNWSYFDKAKMNFQTMFSVALASYNTSAAVNSIIFFALNNQEWLHMV